MTITNNKSKRKQERESNKEQLNQIKNIKIADPKTSGLVIICKT